MDRSGPMWPWEAYPLSCLPFDVGGSLLEFEFCIRREYADAPSLPYIRVLRSAKGRETGLPLFCTEEQKEPVMESPMGLETFFNFLGPRETCETF